MKRLELFKRSSSEQGPGRVEIKISGEAAVIQLLLQRGTVAVARRSLLGWLVITETVYRQEGEEADRKERVSSPHPSPTLQALPLFCPLADLNRDPAKQSKSVVYTNPSSATQRWVEKDEGLEAKKKNSLITGTSTYNFYFSYLFIYTFVCC